MIVKAIKLLPFLALACLVAVACASASESEPAAPPPAAPAPAPAAAPAAPAPAAPAPAPAAAAEAAPAPAVAPAAPAAAPAPAADRVVVSELSAGEIDDNESFKEYLKYRADSSHLFSEAWYEQTPVNVDVSERYVITVKDSERKTVHNATVTIESSDASWQGFSYADGRSLFMPLALSGEFEGTLTLTAEKDGALGTTEVERAIPTGGEWEVVLDGAPDPIESIKLDVLYLLDATGSMADEIESIKSTLTSVASRINDIDAAVDLRMGMVAYRDRGDAYVTQVYEFDSDIPAFAGRVAGVQADEGGDTPESVNEALHASLDSVGWRQDDTVRLVIMVADAGPHMDYQNDPGYDEAMATALRRGVKIHTIASSGLDEFGEYVFRQVAQHTMGKFVFIVYGENGDTPHSVGDQYTIQNLDDLVVNLVAAELDHLND